MATQPPNSKRAYTSTSHNTRLNTAQLDTIIAPTHEGLYDGLNDATALPESIIPLLAWRGRVTLLSGREKEGGKTTYAATAAAALSRGGKHLGHQLQPAKVLWILAEGHKQDLARIMTEAKVNPDNVRIQRRGGHRLTQTHANVADIRPDVAIIDTLATFSDDRITDPSSSSQWLPMLSSLAELAQLHNTALVILAHSTKYNGEVRDSTAIRSSVDMALAIEEHPAGKSVRTIKAIGRWPINDHIIQLTETGWQHYQPTDKQKGSRAEETAHHKVAAHLKKNPTASLNECRKQISGDNRLIDAAYRQIKGIQPRCEP